MCGVTTGSCESNSRVCSTQTSVMAPSVTVPPDSSKVSSDDQQQDPPTREQPQQPLQENSPSLVVENQQPQSDPKSGQTVPRQVVKPDVPVAKSSPRAADISEETDLQKAIALSIMEQQQNYGAFPKPGGERRGADAMSDDMVVTSEDREVSRALEESLKEVPNISIKSKSNPNERKRENDFPVGLVNIGNSCWFNVVSQPLFHLPGFRDMILNYKVCSPPSTPTNSKEKAPVPAKVAVSLSKLFSLMLASEQKFVAPNECVCLFQGGERRRNEQEDVCEFIHKLLERLELEFNEVMREEGEEKESSGLSKDVQFTNPIMKFFYGQFRKENTSSSNSDEYFFKQETFSQYPLHVLNYGDIHDSILSSMSGRLPDRQCSDSQNSNNKCDVQIRQESWFRLLPPVLIFSLSRYEFSQATQRAEKVHNKFEFPELLYMDRYMECNKQLVKKKHVQVAAIKSQLTQLNETLKLYQQFGNCEGKYPLRDVLNYTLRFAETGTTENTGQESRLEPKSEEAENNAGKSETEMVEVTSENIADPSSSSCAKQSKSDSEEGMEVDEKDVRSTNSLTVVYGPPCADVTSTEFEVLQRCLSRWEAQVRSVESDLSFHISQLENQLSEMYSEPELLQIPYRLHAVVVHEGQASSGHYWVYIHDKDGWKKYNDAQVSQSSWEELQQDSLGGQNNASAYCLMYTDTDRHSLLYPVEDVRESLHDLLQTLPLNLQEYVKQDNLAYQEEITKWENRTTQSQSPHTSRGAAVPPPTAPNSPEICASDEEEFDVKVFFDLNTLIVKLITNNIRKLISEKEDPDSELSKIAQETIANPNQMSYFYDITIKICQKVIENIINNVTKEYSVHQLPSVLDFVLYLHHSNAPNSHRLMLMHSYLIFSTISQSYSNIVAEALSIQCQKLLSEYPYSNLAKPYKLWQSRYKLFLDTSWHLLEGWKLFETRDFKKSLPCFLKSCHLFKDMQAIDNPQLCGTNVPSLLPAQLVLECRTKCMLELNEGLHSTFLSCTEANTANEVVVCVSELLHPALEELSNSPNDSATKETISNQWCQLLEKDLPEYLTPLLRQIIETLFLDSSSGRGGTLPNIIRPIPSVHQIFHDYCNLLKKTGN